MKRFIFVVILIISCIWLHYYAIDQCEGQDFRISVINTSIDFKERQISKLRLEEFRNEINHKNKIDSLKSEIAEEEIYLSDAYEKIKYYNSLKNIFNMELIFLLIGLSSLIYWYSHRNDAPTHPKLFWTLIFGWLYILYYICDKKNL